MPKANWRSAILAIVTLLLPAALQAFSAAAWADGGVSFPAGQPIGLPGQPAELNWAQKMFSGLKHDFGGVAKGADVRVQFTVRNIYKERVEIRNPRSSCGCGQPMLIDPKQPGVQMPAISLETNEACALVVKIDTIGHDRAKTPTISVDCAFYAEGGVYTKVVDIPITVYIRPDLVMTPGAAEFGSLDIGAGGERHVNIAYAGNEAWQILKVHSNSKFIQTELKQVGRGGGRVDYDLAIRIARDAPEGELREQLVLQTNDANSPTVPYLVRASITPEFQVVPGTVNFGPLKPGVKKTVTLVIRGKTPFQVQGVECDSQRNCYTAQLARDPKPAQIVQLQIDPPNEPGPLKETFLVTIVGRPGTIKFQGIGQIEAAAAGAGPAPSEPPAN